MAFEAKNYMRANLSTKKLLSMYPTVPQSYRIFLTFTDLFEIFDSELNMTYLRMLKRRLDFSKKKTAVYKPFELIITYIYGIGFLLNRIYHTSIIFFAKCIKTDPTNPFLYLLMCVSYLGVSTKRTSHNRHIEIIHAFHYLSKYRNMRKYKMEIEYNFARAFHFLGLAHLAVRHYENVLELTLDHDKEFYAFGIDLRMEAAYNLALIYMDNGSPGLAHMIYQKYITI